MSRAWPWRCWPLGDDARRYAVGDGRVRRRLGLHAPDRAPVATGNEGVEHLLDIIDGCFSPLLDDAYAAGGTLLKFGGDALLLWFEGPEHAARACDAALAMRATLRRIGQIRAGATTVVLRMSVGVHTGDFQFFLVGDSHREFLIAGPAATEAMAMEAAATAGQVLSAARPRSQLPRRCLGQTVALGTLLARASGVAAAGHAPGARHHRRGSSPRCFSAPMREHVIGHDPAPEHRLATTAFVQFGDFDAMCRNGERWPPRPRWMSLCASPRRRASATGSAFWAPTSVTTEASCCSARARPRALGDDEERMVLALRDIVDGAAVAARLRRGEPRARVRR